MPSIPSATTWGSPASSKHALLIHGLSSSSHVWHRVGPALAAQGFFVTAPNLIGHVSRVSTDYHLSSIVNDLLPYFEARNYTLIIGHSLGAATTLSLFPHLPKSYSTAIVLVDPGLKMPPERLDFLEAAVSDACTNIKSAEAYGVEHPLWSREDTIYRELATRLTSVDAVHKVCGQYRSLDLFRYFHAVAEKWTVTVLVADPAISPSLSVEDLRPYPRVQRVMVPGAGHWIQNEFPEVVVNEALKAVAELETLK